MDLRQLSPSIAAALAVLAIAVPEGASAAPPPGGLVAAECVQQTGFTDCAGSSPGLYGAGSVAISPDGANVYVVAGGSEAIRVFNRAADGSLTPAGCIKNAGSPLACATSVQGLRTPKEIAVSPDGKNLYVTGWYTNLNHVVLTLDRAADGSLSDGGSCYRGSVGPSGCTQIPFFDYPAHIAVTPDGTGVYVAGNGSDSVTAFARVAGGHLDFRGSYLSNDLKAASGLAISPNSDQVYVAGALTDTILTYSRGADSILSYAGCVKNQGSTASCAATAEGLDGPNGLTVSPDGANMYAASNASDTVAALTRGTGGELTGLGSTTGPGLDAAGDVVVGPDGTYVYALSSNLGDNAVVALARGAGGTLSHINCVGFAGHTTCPETTTAFSGPRAIATSPDGKDVYVTAGLSHAVWHFDVSAGDAGSTSGSAGGGPAPAPGAGSPSDSGQAPAAVAPRITGLSLTRPRFAVGARPTPLALAAARGTAFRLSLSKEATVRIAIQRLVRGRYRRAGKLVRPGKAGMNRIRFSGRLGRRALAAGRYRAVATATDAAGRRSNRRAVRFTVTKPDLASSVSRP